VVHLMAQGPPENGGNPCLCALQCYACTVTTLSSVVPLLFFLVGWVAVLWSWLVDCVARSFELAQIRAGVQPLVPISEALTYPNLTQLSGLDSALQRCGINGAFSEGVQQGFIRLELAGQLFTWLWAVGAIIALLGSITSACALAFRCNSCKGAVAIARVQLCATFVVCFPPRKQCATFELAVRLITAVGIVFWVFQLALLGDDPTASGWPGCVLVALGGMCGMMFACIWRLGVRGWRESFAGWCCSRMPGHHALTIPRGWARSVALATMGYLMSQCVVSGLYLLSFWGCSWLGVLPGQLTDVSYRPRETWFPVIVTFVPVFIMALAVLCGSCWCGCLNRKLWVCVAGAAVCAALIAPGVKVQQSQEQGYEDELGLVLSQYGVACLVLAMASLWSCAVCSREQYRAGVVPRVVNDPEEYQRNMRRLTLLIPGGGGPRISFGLYHITENLAGTLTPSVAARVYLRVALSQRRRRDEPIAVVFVSRSPREPAVVP
jgi:hypothetical protein